MSLFGPWYTNMPTPNNSNIMEQLADGAAQQYQQQAQQNSQQNMGYGAGTSSFVPMSHQSQPQQQPVSNPPNKAYAAQANQAQKNQAASSSNNTGPVNAQPVQLPPGVAKDMTVFDPANYTRAMTAALNRAGLTVGTGNPIAQILMRMAPGLAAAFAIRGANNPNGIMNPDDSIGTAFSHFLNNALRGGAQDTLRMARQELGGISAKRDAYNQPGRQGPQNVFMDQINRLMEANPDALPGFVSSLRTPFMGSYARAFGEGMENRYQSKWNQLDYDSPGADPSRQMLDYIASLGR